MASILEHPFAVMTCCKQDV